MDILLVPGERYFIADASAPAPDGLVDLSCGPLTPIPSFASHIDKIYGSLRTSYAADKEKGVLAFKLDKGASIAVNVGVAAEVVRGLCAEVDLSVGAGKGKPA